MAILIKWKGCSLRNKTKRKTGAQYVTRSNLERKPSQAMQWLSQTEPSTTWHDPLINKTYRVDCTQGINGTLIGGLSRFPTWKMVNVIFLHQATHL
jgi:hypothetical protein